jgi:hypothetical protein
MTTSKILDIILPYTKEELRCGMKKQKKGALRIKLAEMILQYHQQIIVDFTKIVPADKVAQLVKLLTQ